MAGEDGFEVLVAELRAAGEASRAVAEGVRGLRLSDPVTRIGDALPGGSAQRSGDNLAVVWGGGLTLVADAMAHHAEAMVASAEEYRAGEERAAAGFGTG